MSQSSRVVIASANNIADEVVAKDYAEYSISLEMTGTVTPDNRMPPKWSHLTTCHRVHVTIASVLLAFRSTLFLMCQPVTASAQGDSSAGEPDEVVDLTEVCNCVSSAN